MPSPWRVHGNSYREPFSSRKQLNAKVTIREKGRDAERERSEASDGTQSCTRKRLQAQRFNGASVHRFNGSTVDG